MTTVNARPIEMILKGTAEHVDILVADIDGNLIDATEVGLTVMNASEAIEHRDTYPGPYQLLGTVTVAAGGTLVTGVGTKFTEDISYGDQLTIGAETHTVAPVTTFRATDTQLQLATPHVAGASGATATRPTRIVKVANATGQYYINYGDPAANTNLPTQTETTTLGDRLFQWGVLGVVGSERVNTIQIAKVVSPTVVRMITYFRLQIDKAIKATSVDPSAFCPLGYTESDLLAYLVGGLGIINAYQPYPTWCRIETFPECFWQTLFDSALVVGINAQTLFAIDTDIENWSDQGNAFVLNHHPKLSAFSSVMSQRLDKLIPQMKLHFVNSGVLHTEMGSNWRLQQIVSMAPTGALFRNMFSSGY